MGRLPGKNVVSFQLAILAKDTFDPLTMGRLPHGDTEATHPGHELNDISLDQPILTMMRAMCKTLEVITYAITSQSSKRDVQFELTRQFTSSIMTIDHRMLVIEEAVKETLQTNINHHLLETNNHQPLLEKLL